MHRGIIIHRPIILSGLCFVVHFLVKSKAICIIYKTPSDTVILTVLNLPNKIGTIQDWDPLKAN